MLVIKNQSNNICQQKTWSGLYNRELTQEETRQIAGNLNGFFETLKEWDNAEKRLNENEQPKRDNK